MKKSKTLKSFQYRIRRELTVARNAIWGVPAPFEDPSETYPFVVSILREDSEREAVRDPIVGVRYPTMGEQITALWGCP